MKNEYIKYILIITLLLILSGINIIINDKIIESNTADSDTTNCDINSLFKNNRNKNSYMNQLATRIEELKLFSNLNLDNHDNDICNLFYRLAIIDSKCSNNCFKSNTKYKSKYDNTYSSSNNSKLAIKSKIDAFFTNLNRVILNYRTTLSYIQNNFLSLIQMHNRIVYNYNSLITHYNSLITSSTKNLETLSPISLFSFNSTSTYNTICIKSNYIEATKNAVNNSNTTYNSITSAILGENVNYFTKQQKITCNDCIEYVDTPASIDKELIDYIENIEQGTRDLSNNSENLISDISYILNNNDIFINDLSKCNFQTASISGDIITNFNTFHEDFYKNLTSSIQIFQSYLENNNNIVDKYTEAINNIYTNIDEVIRDTESNHNFNIVGSFLDSLLVPKIFKMQYPSAKNALKTLTAYQYIPS